jgi:hypothetical protein
VISHPAPLAPRFDCSLAGNDHRRHDHGVVV